jgi:ElaB/YqjD/DUF883 family membrane-anchored ribosome-binding protein
MAQGLDTGARKHRNGAALKARTNDVLDDFAELRKDVSRLAEAATKAARSEVKTARKRFDVMRHDLRSRASNGVEYIRDRAGTGVEYATDQVRTHPGAAIGISLGAGLVIGLLLSARR